MKKMKKTLALVLSIVMVCAMFSLTGCGKSSDTKSDSTKATTAAVTENPTDAEEPAAEEVDLTTISAVDFARLMGNGINLGNTMEAYGKSSYGTTALVGLYETAWGQPQTTAEMIQGMKDAGFDTIRIPVAWTNTMDWENDNYTISQEYLDRVKEIVDYAYAADMYVIVNDHWDGGWWGLFGQEDETLVAKAWTIYESIWTQVGETFKDYDNHLIFESANEEVGSRLNDAINDVPGVLTTDEYYDMANQINQKFVDLIRAQGGNNENRFLLIAGINTNIDATCDDRFQMPTDTASDKLLLSVHYYDPWSYCGDDGSSNSWGCTADYEYMNETLAKMAKFTDQGIPVVIGEYGVLNLIDGEEKVDTVKYMTNLFDNCDLYGLVPVLWDTGTQYNRTECKMNWDDTAEFVLSRNVEAQSSMTIDEEKEAAQKEIDETLANSPESLADTDFTAGDDATVITTIMFENASWGNAYSIGDTYAPDTSTGVVPTEMEVTGEGVYTVALDYSACGTNTGCQFSALAVYNGETVFPGYCVENLQVTINGEPFELLGKPYTTSDDGTCTRVNLYNQWCKPGIDNLPEEARCADGDLTDCTPWLIEDPDGAGIAQTDVQTIEITFDYVAPENFESYVADRDAWVASLAE